MASYYLYLNCYNLITINNYLILVYNYLYLYFYLKFFFKKKIFRNLQEKFIIKNRVIKNRVIKEVLLKRVKNFFKKKVFTFINFENNLNNLLATIYLYRKWKKKIILKIKK